MADDTIVDEIAAASPLKNFNGGNWHRDRYMKFRRNDEEDRYYREWLERMKAAQKAAGYQ